MRSSDINLVTKLGLCIPRRVRRCNSQSVFCTGNEGPKVSKLSFPTPLYDNQRFLLSVRMCVTDVGVAIMNLRVVCKIIMCVSAFTEMAILIFLEIVKAIAGLSGHSALQATRRLPLWVLAIALATGKNTRLIGVLYQNETRFFTYVSQHAESKAATVATSN